MNPQNNPSRARANSRAGAASDPNSKGVGSKRSARHRILLTALKLFAEQGFKKTSIREIAAQSACNIAAVSYYFGDKEGLYRAAFNEPVQSCGPGSGLLSEQPARVGQHHCLIVKADLFETLLDFYGHFLAPLARGEEARQLVKLHFREMLEPTGIWQEAIENEIGPEHQMMVKLLMRELGLKRADLDVQRLAMALIGMAVHFFVGQDVVAKIAPAVLATPKAIDQLADRLAHFAVGMIGAEKNRRAGLER